MSFKIKLYDVDWFMGRSEEHDESANFLIYIIDC
jgi:hypothetical protein